MIPTCGRRKLRSARGGCQWLTLLFTVASSPADFQISLSSPGVATVFAQFLIGSMNEAATITSWFWTRRTGSWLAESTVNVWQTKAFNCTLLEWQRPVSKKNSWLLLLDAWEGQNAQEIKMQKDKPLGYKTIIIDESLMSKHFLNTINNNNKKLLKFYFEIIVMVVTRTDLPGI